MREVISSEILSWEKTKWKISWANQLGETFVGKNWKITRLQQLRQNKVIFQNHYHHSHHLPLLLKQQRNNKKLHFYNLKEPALKTFEYNANASWTNFLRFMFAIQNICYLVGSPGILPPNIGFPGISQWT